MRNSTGVRSVLLGRVVREAQEVLHAYAGNLRRVLKGEKDTQPRALIGFQRQHVLPLEPCMTAVDRISGVAHQGVGEGGLATAVRPHDRVDFAGAHGEVQPLDDLPVPHRDTQVFHTSEFGSRPFVPLCTASAMRSVLLYRSVIGDEIRTEQTPPISLLICCKIYHILRMTGNML